MPRFVLIARDDPASFEGMGPSDFQRIIERYHAWTEDLRRQGRLHLGEKLVDGAGAVLRGASTTDGPFAESKEVVGGLWIIEADDLSHALRLLDGCPQAEYGSLEVREIEVLDLPEG